MSTQGRKVRTWSLETGGSSERRERESAVRANSSRPTGSFRSRAKSKANPKNEQKENKTGHFTNQENRTF